MAATPPPIERNDFDIILAHLLEGVIVVDHDGRVIWINPAAETVIGLRDHQLRGRRACEVFKQPELREIFSRGTPVEPGRGEIKLAEGQTASLLITPLSDGGAAVIFHEFAPSTLIEQSRREYANSIAHDLRSPLTAILGFAQLIALASPTTPRQAEFIRQIQASVQKINTYLNPTDGAGSAPTARPEINLRTKEQHPVNGV